MEFSERLSLARKRKKMTQADLARQSGLTRAVISKWEKGESGHPSANAVQQAAGALGVSVEQLLTGRRDQALVRRFTEMVDKLEMQWGDLTPEKREALVQQVERLNYLVPTKSIRSGKKKTKTTAKAK